LTLNLLIYLFLPPLGVYVERLALTRGKQEKKVCCLIWKLDVGGNESREIDRRGNEILENLETENLQDSVSLCCPLLLWSCWVFRCLRDLNQLCRQTNPAVVLPLVGGSKLVLRNFCRLRRSCCMCEFMIFRSCENYISAAREKVTNCVYLVPAPQRAYVLASIE
jgi:hypothetical protein